MNTAPRLFHDAKATRDLVFSGTLAAAQALAPVSNRKHTLSLSDVRYIDPPDYSKPAHKRALLEGNTLSRRLRGVWTLTDNATGHVLDRREQVIAHVPLLTDLGTFVHNGTDYGLSNQQRLKAGIYVRRKENDELEAHANVKPGTGLSHRYALDPAKGLFHLNLAQAKLPLLPLLRAAGVTDAELRDAWGPQLFAANMQRKNDAATLKKLQDRLLSRADLEAEPDAGKALVKKFAAMQLDPEVTRRTLGRPYTGLTPDAILATTRKLLAASRGEADVDDRDHMAFQHFLGPEDLFAERLSRDFGHTRRQLLNRATFRGDLKSMPSSSLRSQVEAALLASGLGQSLEEINPAEILDKQTRLSRMGVGGIPSLDAIPDEARAVQPSHLGFVDPVRSPESAKVGVDVNLSRLSRKHPDGSISAPFRDLKTGQVVWKTPLEVADAKVAFDPVAGSPYDHVPVMSRGRIDWVHKNEVDYEVPHFESAFSPLANLIPLKSATKGQRVSMGSRMLTQALSLVNREAPLVRTAVPDGGGRSFEEEYSGHMGALRADKDGVVREVTPDAVVVRHRDGTETRHELYSNQPFNRKSFLNQIPVVRSGDAVGTGQLLAHSNYTDKAGVSALGVNARTAYVPWGGLNFEDAVVISESMAKRLTSEHMYQHHLPIDDKTRVNKNAYLAHYPGRHAPHHLRAIDDDGVIKVGSRVEHGQPLVLALRERDRAANRVHKPGQPGYSDQALTWEHEEPGVVTDVVHAKDGPLVVVKLHSGMHVGDKMSGLYGDKGVVSAIIPDHKMPHDREGRPFEVLTNPLGVISRGNPSQAVAAWLGKVAEKTGRPYVLSDFGDVKNWVEFARSELHKHGLQDFEPIVDPNTGRTISPAHYERDPQTGQLRKVGAGVLTGSRYFLKLHHQSEGKMQARSSGAYSADEAPAKGGVTGSKRVALLDVNALMAHGAVNVLRDSAAVRGQKNDDYWLRFMQGYDPQDPHEPMVYDKFLNQLRASGVNVVRDGTQTHIMALRRQDVDALTGGRHVTTGDTVRFDKGLQPVPGGLFDSGLTGGHGGRLWSAIPLHEPLLNPAMEEPARHLLRLTQKQFEGVIAGTHAIQTGTGPRALATALERINVPLELGRARVEFKQGTQAARDAAAKRIGYLKALQRLNMNPGDWVLDKAPVLPPVFRPVSLMGASGLPLVSDPNYLYKDLVEANDNLKKMHAELGPDHVGPERLALYHALKAVTGLGDPVGAKSREKGVKGIIKTVVGSSPKFGTVQRKLISSTVDNVGRAVVSPDPAYDMDSLGMPENLAFPIYEKFAVRRLVRRGMRVADALREVRDRSPLARQALLAEMEARPVVVNRAPVLHKFGIMAFRPQLTAGSTLRVSPLVVKGFGMDFDGDAVQFHVPTGEAEAREALERMVPSASLLSPADFVSPVHAPGQEYLGGLYAATAPSAPDAGKRVRYFATKADALRAYRRKELGVDDPIHVAS